MLTLSFHANEVIRIHAYCSNEAMLLGANEVFSPSISSMVVLRLGSCAHLKGCGLKVKGLVHYKLSRLCTQSQNSIRFRYIKYAQC